MMNVQTMRHIVDPLHAGRMPGAAQAALQCWHGESLEYIRSSANHIFRFTQHPKQYYLRLAHGSERSREYLQAELEFVEHLANTGLAVAQPIPSVNGELIEEVEDGGQPYFAVVFEGLQGEQLELEDLDEPLYRTWGHALALLHRASKTFPRHPARPHWQDQIRAAFNSLPPEEIAVARTIETGLAWLDTLAAKDYGLIHGDFELDNLVWEGKQVQVLDLDGAVYTWYAADIAIALQDVWVEGGIDREQRMGWFLEGYAEILPVPDDIRELIPRFLNLLLAVKVAQLLRAYSTTTDDQYPDWFIQMRNYHQNWMVTKRAALSLY